MRVRQIIGFLLIAALGSFGISPACAFVSGKVTLIEICAADGSLQTVAVDESGQKVDKPAPGSGHQANKKHDCAFCTASAQAKITPEAFILNLPVAESLTPRAEVKSLNRFAGLIPAARGPPASL
jgi:hypothetical protein